MSPLFILDTDLPLVISGFDYLVDRLTVLEQNSPKNKSRCVDGIELFQNIYYLYTLISANIFLAALVKDGAINEEQLSEQQLDKVYSELRKQVSESLHKQEALLAKIQVDNIPDWAITARVVNRVLCYTF